MRCAERSRSNFSIFVKSKLASERVKSNITNFVESKLHLKINEEKSQICRPNQYFMLGYGFVPSYKKGDRGKYNLRLNPKSFNKLKQEIKEITRKTSPISFTDRLIKLRKLTQGWVGYYRFAHIKSKLKTLDSWVRKRLRYCIWKDWKKPNNKSSARLCI